jgi:hypothetical protein
MGKNLNDYEFGKPPVLRLTCPDCGKLVEIQEEFWQGDIIDITHESSSCSCGWKYSHLK